MKQMVAKEWEKLLNEMKTAEKTQIKWTQWKNKKRKINEKTNKSTNEKTNKTWQQKWTNENNEQMKQM